MSMSEESGIYVSNLVINEKIEPIMIKNRSPATTELLRYELNEVCTRSEF